jgi:hypothetical protein
MMRTKNKHQVELDIWTFRNMLRQCFLCRKEVCDALRLCPSILMNIQNLNKRNRYNLSVHTTAKRNPLDLHMFIFQLGFLFWVLLSYLLCNFIFTVKIIAIFCVFRTYYTINTNF